MYTYKHAGVCFFSGCVQHINNTHDGLLALYAHFAINQQQHSSPTRLLQQRIWVHNNARTNLFNTQATHVSNQIEGPFVNSFLMTLNLVQAVPGLCMNVLGARAGVFFEPLPANWRIRRVTQVQTISLVYGEHERLSQRTYVFGFTQTLVKRLLAVPSFSFCCCHTALFTCMLLQLPRCSMGLLLSASTTNCCWDSGSVGACCVDRGLCLVLLPLQLLLICLAPGTQQQGTQAAHQLPSPPCVSTILYFFFFFFTCTRTDKMHI